MLTMEQALERADEPGPFLVGAESFGQALNFNDWHRARLYRRLSDFKFEISNFKLRPRPQQARKTRFPECSSRKPNLTQQLLLQVTDGLTHVSIDLHPVLHQPAGVQHGPVVASAKGFADGIEGAFRHVSGQVHGNLPGKGDVLWSALA